MTVIYSQNFDSTGVGDLPTGWTPIAGTTWAVQNATCVSSPNALGSSSPDSAIILFTGTSALADMDVSWDIKPNSSSSFMGIILRASSDAQNGYFVIPENAGNLNGNWHIFKVVGGISNSINTSSISGLFGAVSIRARVQGSTISAKIWRQGTSEPSGDRKSVV